MKPEIIYGLTLLLAAFTFTGCYTQLGYHTASDYEPHYYQVRHPQEAESQRYEEEEEEYEEHHREDDREHRETERYGEDERDDKDGKDAYHHEKESEYHRETDTDHRRQRYTHRYIYVYPDRTAYTHYWAPHPYTSWAPYYYHPYRYYRPFGYSYGYRSPWFYNAYRYRPYPSTYRRYYGGKSSRYIPHTKRTYKRRAWRSETGRSRNSRSVTAPNKRSGRIRR